MSWKEESLTWHFVEKWADRKPEAEVLVDEKGRLNWREFSRGVDLVAKAMLEAGVEKGDVVAMLDVPCNEFPIVYMAAGKVGAMWLGLAPKFTLDELRYIFNDAKPAVLFTMREYMNADLGENIKALVKEFPFLKKVIVKGGALEGTEDYYDYTGRPREEMDAALEERAESVTPEDDALLLYTSGSTGKPKGVVHTHRSLIANVSVASREFGFNEQSRLIVHMPINHVAADTEIGLSSIYVGGALVHMAVFEPARSLEVIEKEKVTVTGQIPVMYLLQMKTERFRSTDFSAVKSFVWGGSAAPLPMIQALAAIAEKTGTILVNGYGSTEVGGFISFTKRDDGVEDLQGTLGVIAEPHEIKVVDKDRRELAAGEIGEFAFRGPFLMKKYLNKPEATAEVMDDDGWFYSSDIGYMDERGYIYITGRKSEMYKTAGENVFPREIEEVLEQHPSVGLAAVVGVPHDFFGEVGWAFAMKTPGAPDVQPGELRGLCKEKLADYKVPRKFIVRDLLPMLPNGKINKPALKREIEEEK